tara:strand:- start:65 stop:2869 length:2805 start_codon:yes stop_codon:yes gene_type:complete
MFLGNLLNSIKKDYKKIHVNGISFDSRKVKKKDVFFAINGTKTSGNKFIYEAISKGASVIVSEKYKNYRIPLILVKDVRESLAEACSKFYTKKPSNIIAVTGTNGKSSVVNFFYQILLLNRVAVASIGTLGITSRNYKKKTNLTSVDPLSLHKNLQMLKKNKIKNVILEASSHGLDQKRLNNIDINIGIFTNLSHDHLDYHKTMKSYLKSKIYLFDNLLKKNSKIITDEDNKEFKIIKKIANRKKIKKITIGTNSGNIIILNNKYKKDKQIVNISINSKIYKLKVPLIGFFQIKNLLMAVLAAHESGLNLSKIFDKINKIKPVNGRLERVRALKNNSQVIVDFAHTPDALEQSLIAIKEQFKRKIIIVFGCGGDRDKKKRFKMGMIASKYCRKIFVTDDNPRNENSENIRRSIIKGCKKLAVNIGNRKKAIESAMNELAPNEILLIAGKGHEETQDFGRKIIKFSDKKIIRQTIIKKNYLKNISDTNFQNIKYDGVSINSKIVKKNNLFFAIKGKNNDGHLFAREAVKKGAAKLIVSRKIKNISNNKFIKVKNTFTTLNNLAKSNRKNCYAEIIGITGSVGKTTLKNLIGFSLKNYGKVYHSPQSYNNKYGVPLSLANLKSNFDYGVFEIGMDKKGEIDKLSSIVKPEIAIITNISAAHFKNFHTLEDIAKAKAEIIDNITKGGNIVLDKNSKFFNFLSKKAKKHRIKVTSFSIKKKSDVFLISIKKIRNYFRLKINVKNKILFFNVKYSTNSFLNNILACIATLNLLNLNINKMKNKFMNFNIPEGRGDIKIVKKFNKKFKFIDESYNANPLSMSSAINNMNHYSINKKLRRFVLLGDMLELGKRSKRFHRDLSSVINRSKIDKVFVYGKHIKETFNGLLVEKKGKIFKNLKEAYNHFNKILHNHDLLMVKGSNATGLGEFSKNIKKGQISAL